MGLGAFIEPAVVVGFLFGGTWFNRNTSYSIWNPHPIWRSSTQRSLLRDGSPDSFSSGTGSSDTLLEEGYKSSLLSNGAGHQEPRWRKRELKFFGLKREVVSPNTRVFKHYFLSRLLKKFPFLVEAWYWALIYWVNLPSPRPLCSCTIPPSLNQADPTTNPTGLPTRPSLHSRHARRRNRRRRAHSRTPNHPIRKSARPLPRARDPALLPTAPNPATLDQQDLLLHPHPRHHPIPRLPVLLHHDNEPLPLLTALHLPLPLHYLLAFNYHIHIHTPPPHPLPLQPPRLHHLHTVALHAPSPPQRPILPRRLRRTCPVPRLRRYRAHRHRREQRVDAE